MIFFGGGRVDHKEVFGGQELSAASVLLMASRYRL